jgi:hypothetical protein
MIYACPAYKTRFSAPFEIFQGAHQSAIFTLIYFPYVYVYITKLCRQQTEVIQNIRMNIFALEDKVSQDIEKKGLILTVVKLTTVQMAKLPL